MDNNNHLNFESAISSEETENSDQEVPVPNKSNMPGTETSILEFVLVSITLFFLVYLFSAIVMIFDLRLSIL